MARRLRIAGLLAVMMVGLVFLYVTTFPPARTDMLIASDGTRVRALYVQDTDGRVLWKISNTTGEFAPVLGAIRYGDTPSAFRQEIPPSGTPRPFVDGEHLEVHLVTEREHFGEGGRARGARSF